MEPMAAKDLSATPRFLFSLLALCVGLFVATFAAPAHAQAVAPDRCAEPAQVADDGDDADMVTEEGSVAVGCDSEVLRTHTREASESADQPLLTLDAGDDGSVDHYLVKVDCGMTTEMAACEGRTGVQYASISEELYMRLRGVTEDPTTHLTEEEMSSLMTMLADSEPLGEIVVGLNRLVDDPATNHGASHDGDAGSGRRRCRRRGCQGQGQRRCRSRQRRHGRCGHRDHGDIDHGRDRPVGCGHRNDDDRRPVATTASPSATARKPWAKAASPSAAARRPWRTVR